MRKDIALQAVRIRGIPPKNAEIHRLAEISQEDVVLPVTD